MMLNGFPLEKFLIYLLIMVKILESAIDTLKWKVRNKPIGFELLPQKFTLLQLQELI